MRCVKADVDDDDDDQIDASKNQQSARSRDVCPQKHTVFCVFGLDIARSGVEKNYALQRNIAGWIVFFMIGSLMRVHSQRFTFIHGAKCKS